MNSMPEMPKKQTVILRDRHTLELDAVSDVVGFDETGVTLRTALGGLSVEGEGLRITRLDLEKGVVALEGKITALFYTHEGNGRKGGFFARMVK